MNIVPVFGTTNGNTKKKHPTKAKQKLFGPACGVQLGERAIEMNYLMCTVDS